MSKITRDDLADAFGERDAASGMLAAAKRNNDQLARVHAEKALCRAHDRIRRIEKELDRQSGTVTR